MTSYEVEQWARKESRRAHLFEDSYLTWDCELSLKIKR
jgi:hypothetical protein